MKALSLIILFLLTFFNNIYSQVDTLICYDCRTKSITTISPPQVNTSKDFDNTSWYLGQDSNKVTFNPENPENILPASNLTEIKPARTVFDMSDFPVRAVVKIFRYEDRNLLQELGFSGIMVSKNMVLTAGHGLYDYAKQSFIDSLLIIPAYNNNLTNPPFGSSVSNTYYILKRFYNCTLPLHYPDDFKEMFATDIALIRLNEPIGANTGWVGIAYSETIDYYQNKVFHQFSYPNQDPYDGTEMYYAKGVLNVFDDILGMGNYGQAFSGQSGSSLLYSDNSKYYSIGALKGYNNMLGSDATFHPRITRNMFYAFKSILGNDHTAVEKEIHVWEPEFKLNQNYPNPFNPATTITYHLPKKEYVTLKIYNLNGQELYTLVNEFQSTGDHEISWQPADLPGGLYFFRLQAGKHAETRKLIYQK